jgi:chromate transport protein ChrA
MKVMNLAVKLRN